MIIAVLLLITGHFIAMDGLFVLSQIPQENARARVTEIIQRISPEERLFYLDDYESGEVDDSFLTLLGESIIFEAETRNGQRRGSTVLAEQNLGGLSGESQKEAALGDRVLLVNFGYGWFYNGHIRTGFLLGLGVLFTLCVLFFGGKKGFNTLLSLSLTCAAVFAVFIPSILSGKNIYLMAALVCIYATITTLLIVAGYNKKALAASIGCISGILVTGLISVIMDNLLSLTGLLDEHSRHLANLPIGTPIDLRAIIFAGIIIGAMGAIMDVSISIASSMWEIREKAGRISVKSLFQSGINIGRDIMGSMANTLILAYIGGSLSVVLILSVYSNSLMELLNREMIVVEILQALAGIFGILSAMPLTAFFSAALFLRDKKQAKI